MSYLLWQIFACLLCTALLFLAIGWLLRGWLRRGVSDGDVVTGSERTSWQSQLDGLRSRLEAETSRKIAAERALDDSQNQCAKFSSLLDQHTAEVATCAEELAAKSKALEGRDVTLNAVAAENSHLKDQLAELSPKLAAAVAAGAEAVSLRTQVSKLQSSDGDAVKLRPRIAELETQLKTLTADNARTKAQVDDANKKLAAAQSAFDYCGQAVGRPRFCFSYSDRRQ